MKACCVADQFCTHPANADFTPIEKITTCYCCGDNVCYNCSMIVLYNHRNCRLCHNCIVDLDGNDNRVMDRLYKDAGYEVKNV